MLADVVVALQRGEAAEGGGDADGGEAGMAGGGIRTAVVHGRTDGDPGRHFVVEQATDFWPQAQGDLRVSRIIDRARVRIDACGEIAFELFDDAATFIEVFGDDGQRCVAEHFGLQRFRRFEKLLAASAEQRIGVAVPGPRARSASMKLHTAGRIEPQ